MEIEDLFLNNFMTPTTDYSGIYTAIAGLLVSGLANLGIVTNAGDIATIIGAVVILAGLVKQYIAHKKLASAVVK